MGPTCTLPPSDKALCGIQPERKILLYLFFSLLIALFIGFTARLTISKPAPTRPSADFFVDSNGIAYPVSTKRSECHQQCGTVCAESCARDGSLALFNRAMSMI